MAHASERRLPEGVTVAVHRNAGLRKVCNCPRRGWAKCPHPWHFNYSWRGAAYRFSLNRYACKEITGKSALLLPLPAMGPLRDFVKGKHISPDRRVGRITWEQWLRDRKQPS